jgi:hypothetical protein
LITIRRAKTDLKIAQKTAATKATLKAPALLSLASEDLAGVGKIAELSLVESDTVELVSIDMEPLDD